MYKSFMYYIDFYVAFWRILSILFCLPGFIQMYL